MTKKKKSPKQQPTEEIQMANNDIMAITGIKMKYLFLRKMNMGIFISLLCLILHLYSN